MKIKLDNIHIPCETCHFDGYVGSEKDYCQRCDYSVSVQLLKYVVRENDNCSYCRHILPLRGGYIECALGDEALDSECKKKNLMDLDYKKLVEDYEIPMISGGE